MGNDAFHAKRWQQAVDFYTQAIALDDGQNNHVLYSNRSAAFLKLNKADDALKDAVKCIQLKPEYAKGYGRKAEALLLKKKYDLAISEYAEGIERAAAAAGTDDDDGKLTEVFHQGIAKAKQAKMQEKMYKAQNLQATKTVAAQKAAAAKETKSVSQFVQASRVQLQLEMIALQAQLDLINALAELSDKEKMEMLFALIDKDGSGRIDAKELAAALRKRNANLPLGTSLDRAMNMVALFDQDGDAKLDLAEFETLVDTLVEELEGTTFHEFSEFLLLQLITAEMAYDVEDAVVDAVADQAVDVEQEIKAREAAMDPRMVALFLMFDKDGDGSIDFTEVALGLYQLTDDMEGSAQMAMEMLLMMDKNDVDTATATRTLDYTQFSCLILSFVALVGSSFDEIADELTLAMIQPVEMKQEDLATLVVADEYYQAYNDFSDAMTEEMMVIDALQYGKTQKLFDLWDADKNGYIDFNELLLGMRKFQGIMDMNESVERAALVMLGFDEDSNQKLDRQEFARAIVNFASAMNVELHELIDFMIAVTALAENSDFEKAYANAISSNVSGDIHDIQQLFLALDEEEEG